MFWAVKVETAFPVEIMGTMQMDSILVPAEYPASTEEPKPFTTDCTSSMPMDTMDCCTMEGIAIRTMEARIPVSYFAIFPSASKPLSL